MSKETNYKLGNIKELKLNIFDLNKKINKLSNNIKKISSNVSTLSNTISTISNPPTPMSSGEHFINQEIISIQKKIKNLILNNKSIQIRLLFNNETYYTVKVLCLTNYFLVVQTKELYNTNDNSYNLIVIIPITFSKEHNLFVNENSYNNMNQKLNSNRNNITINIKTNLQDINALKKDYFDPIGMYLNKKYYINDDINDGINFNYHLSTLFKIFKINIIVIKGFANTRNRKENKYIRNINDHKHFIKLISNINTLN